MNAPMDKCPYCGSSYGYYTKDYFCGASYFNYKFDGSEADNTEMYSPLKHKQGKIAYCGKCNKKLFRVS